MVSFSPTTQGLSALHELYTTQNELSRNLTRLSTARRINQAADDAAGLAMSSTMDARVGGFHQYGRNALDAIGLTDVVDGALEGATDLLTRAEELSIRAANDTLSSDERAILNQELDGIKAELNDLNQSTGMNGRALFGDSFQFAVDEGGPITMDVETIDAASLGIQDLSLATPEDARAAMSPLRDALTRTVERRAGLGTTARELRATADRLGVRSIQTQAAASRIADTDFAREVVDLSSNQIKAQAGAAALAHNQATLRSALSIL